MKLRFQADADFNEDIVAGVIRRELGIDFQTATDAELKGVLDEQVLAVAAHEQRLLVTHDRKTMPAHFAEFMQGGQSPGVLIVSQRASVAVVIEELLLIWAASEAEEYVNRICEIPL